MSAFRVGFIGVGDDPTVVGPNGFAMAYRHAEGYAALTGTCEMVAACDIIQGRVDNFRKRFSIPSGYLDYHQMLEKEKLDIVSVCTWPHLHESMVIDCVAAGVKAIHCEKPMANTWGGCKRMTRAAADKGIKLTFNHQRRFGAIWRKAKGLIDDGAIGRIVRVEHSSTLPSSGPFARYDNICDYGSHGFDMCGYFIGQCPGEWVMAQIDYRQENLIFGAHNENAAVALWKYRNGIHGHTAAGLGPEIIGAHNRVIGTDGIIEVRPVGEGLPPLRIRQGNGGWEPVSFPEEPETAAQTKAIADIVRALADGTTSELCAENALESTELIFACWESARRRGRVELPLDIEDHPLVEMVSSKALQLATA